MISLDLRRNPEGKRYVQPYLGTNKVTGKPLRPYRSFPDELTDEECLDEAQKWLKTILPYSKIGASSRLGDLLELYLEQCKAENMAANTLRTYRTLTGLVGALADSPVKDISTYDINELYVHLIKHGGEMRQGLSQGTVIALHRFLRCAWKYMADIGAADINPVLNARVPKPDAQEASVIEETDYPMLRRVIAGALDASQPARKRCVALAAYLSLNTGMRCGEVCALIRRDVSFVSRSLHIGATVTEGNGRPVRQQKTKGKRSRNIEVADDVLGVLRDWIDWQNATFKRTGTRTPIVSFDGSLMRPSVVSREFSALVRDAGLPEGITFHSLRHTHASWLIAGGVDAKTVSERLGHADIATTLRIYSHVLPGRDRQAAETFSHMTGGLP